LVKCIIHEELTAKDTEWNTCEKCHADSRKMEEEYFKHNPILKIPNTYRLQ